MKRFAMLFMGVLALVGCADDDDNKSRNERKPIVLDQQQKAAVEAANNIAAEAFEAAYSASRNNAFSPLSVNMGVSMMANGAAGETLDHMLRALAPAVRSPRSTLLTPSWPMSCRKPMPKARCV